MSDFYTELEQSVIKHGANVQSMENTFESRRVYWFTKGFRIGLGIASIVAFKKLRFITIPLTAAEFLISYSYLFAAEYKEKMDKGSLK